MYATISSYELIGGATLTQRKKPDVWRETKQEQREMSKMVNELEKLANEIADTDRLEEATVAEALQKMDLFQSCIDVVIELVVKDGKRMTAKKARVLVYLTTMHTPIRMKEFSTPKPIKPPTATKPKLNLVGRRRQ